MAERPYRSRYVRCITCDKVVTLNNLITHVGHVHPERRHEPRETLFAETEQPSTKVVPRSPRKPKPTTELAVVKQIKPKPLPPFGLDDLDVVVLGVVEQITKAVPIELLPALFTWREATASFLTAVDERRVRS